MRRVRRAPARHHDVGQQGHVERQCAAWHPRGRRAQPSGVSCHVTTWFVRSTSASWHEVEPTAKVAVTATASEPQVSVALSGALVARVQALGPARGTATLESPAPSRPATGPLVAEAPTEPATFDAVELDEAAKLDAVPERVAVEPSVGPVVLVVVGVAVAVGVGVGRAPGPPRVRPGFVVEVVVGADSVAARGDAPEASRLVPDAGGGPPRVVAPRVSTSTINNSGLDHRTHVEAAGRRRRVIRSPQGTWLITHSTGFSHNGS